MLAVLVYASLIGMHHSTEIARALETDAAFRLLSGGYCISHQTLRRFLARNRSVFQQAIEQTVRLAHEDGLLEGRELAVDSVRLRANASKAAVRTIERSKKRLEELARVDLSALTPSELERHEAKVRKHQDGLKKCLEQDRSNVVLTNESAGLMKFGDGATGPGHRATVVAAGVKQRLVVGVLIDAASCDYGKLGPALTEARRVLLAAGVPEGTELQAAADAGYFCGEDLRFALENRDWVDVLIASETASSTGTKRKLFGTTDFPRGPGGIPVCPAGKRMHGPYYGKTQPDVESWNGVGCRDCPLREQCTTVSRRTLSLRPKTEKAREAMILRMRAPDARKRYSERISTVEPVFSSIESTMRYRSVCARVAHATRAEILLKLLAHNISRLIAARKLVLVLLAGKQF